MSNNPSFDTKAFLRDRWPGATQLHAWLSSYAPVEKQTVYKWVSRDSIPTERFALILSLLEMESGAPVSLAKYLK